MKSMYVERFTLQDFLDGFRTEDHINMFKKNLELCKQCNNGVNKTAIEFLEFLIDGKNKERASVYLPYHASDFFNYIYDNSPVLSIYRFLNKEPHQWIKESTKYGDYFNKLIEREDNKKYWKKKSIEQEYVNEDIIITDSCYLYTNIDREDEKRNQTPYDLIADTIYGDWSCTCYNKDTKEIIGQFCADAGNVCIAKLRDVLAFNPTFKTWMEQHDWCVTLIKNFTGTAYIKYDINEYMYKGKNRKELYCYVEGIGNINFIANQTGM